MINWSQKLFTFYSRLDPSVIIMYHHKLYLLLVIHVVSCHAAFEETSRFLTDNGFGHVSQQFVEEEIEVRQIPSLPDQVLADLGVRTVGARLRLRSAASQWVPNQVISFLSLEISFVQIFFQPSRPEDVEQGEPDQPDHHVDGEGGEGGEGGDVGDDVEAAAGLHFFSLTKSTGLFSCCNLLFLFNARSDHTPLQPWCLPNGPSLSQAKREGLLFLFRQELQGQVK